MKTDIKARKKIIIGVFYFLLLLFIDLLTKKLAVIYLKDTDGIKLINGVLELLYVENNGMAFSMLKGQQALFLITTPIICAVIIYVLIKILKEENLTVLFYLLVTLLSGAAGNFIDRARTGYVVDFIYFSLIDFPVFNVADIYVTVTVFLLFMVIIFDKSAGDALESVFQKSK